MGGEVSKSLDQLPLQKKMELQENWKKSLTFEINLKNLRGKELDANGVSLKIHVGKKKEIFT
jgi:hypothetical protein